MGKIRNLINTRLNHIKIKERCSTAYKHFPTIQRMENGNIESKCCWCGKKIDIIANENNLDEMRLQAFYKTQMEFILYTLFYLKYK